MEGVDTTVTTGHDVRITRSGAWMRRWKIDELPQLLNVIRGDMSLVGPRPDVPGFADLLSGADRIVLSVRPGITGPATLAFRHEEWLLTTVADPESHNPDRAVAREGGAEPRVRRELVRGRRHPYVPGGHACAGGS